MPDPFEFREEADERSTSWERADPDRALIERRAWNEWALLLPDGEEAHRCRLERDHGAYVGECDCPGYEYHDGPCAHTCTLLQKHEITYWLEIFHCGGNGG
ncbi:SWIM zinc finger family protein [Haloglomus salinum]|uniref:SWIM zinc finger family protein n=1 Tax=Haloglomus salinum TaxID=2962673 RepID=UPI0020CA1D04|nr:SWIM zinc finger family protein [Haloglomus salinum]